MFNQESSFDSTFDEGMPFILQDNHLKMSSWMDELLEKEGAKKIAVDLHQEEVFNPKHLGDLEPEHKDHTYVAEDIAEDIGEWIPTSTPLLRATYLTDMSSRTSEIASEKEDMTDDIKAQLKKSQDEKVKIFNQVHHQTIPDPVERLSNIDIDSGNDLSVLSNNQSTRQNQAKWGKNDIEVLNTAKKLITYGHAKKGLQQELVKQFGEQRIASFISSSMNSLNGLIKEQINNWGKKDYEVLTIATKLIKSGAKKEELKTKLASTFGSDRVDYFLSEAAHTINEIAGVTKSSLEKMTHLKNTGTKLEASKNEILITAKKLINYGYAKKRLQEELVKQYGEQKVASFIMESMDSLNGLIKEQVKNWGKNDSEMLNIATRLIKTGAKKEDLKVKLASAFGADRIDYFLAEAAHSINEIAGIRRSPIEHISNTGTKLEQQKSVPTLKFASKMKKTAYLSLTEGQELESVKATLKDKYGSEEFHNFISQYGTELEKVEHKIGRIYVDSNVYSNCDEMLEHSNKVASKGVLLLKANCKCEDCNYAENHVCKKTSMFIVDNPIHLSAKDAHNIIASIDELKIMSKETLNAYNEQIEKSANNLPMIKMLLKDVKHFASLAKDASKKASQNVVKNDGGEMREVFSDIGFDTFDEQLDDFQVDLGLAI